MTHNTGKKALSWTTSEGERLMMDLYGNPDSKEPILVYLHGFKGFKDWGFVPHMGQFIAGHGIRVLAFNFSHNGIGGDPLQFTELRRFEDNTFSRELRETQELVQALRQGEIEGLQAPEKIALMGHSRGGGIALLASRFLQQEIKAVVTWSAVSTFFRYPPDVISDWHKNGFFEVLNSRTGQVMKLGWGLHQDLLDHGHDRLFIELAVKHSPHPLCIIHGNEDKAVDVGDALRIAHWAKESHRPHVLHLIEGAGHTFNAVHPFEGVPKALQEALDHTVSFLKDQIS